MFEVEDFDSAHAARAGEVAAAHVLGFGSRRAVMVSAY